MTSRTRPWKIVLSLVVLLLAGRIHGGCSQRQPGSPTAAPAAPALLRAAPCRVAPRIDGFVGPGEWAGACRVEAVLRMNTVKGEARPARRVRLWVMNSASNLYVACRVPDAARDMQASPVVADLALLAFCRGDNLAEGDDRRVVLPGVYADKHFVAPGKDADDPRRDGKAAMRWSRTTGGGEYVIEWQVALDAGDRNDIAAAPGGSIRFNLVYADRFGPGLETTEIGGLFGADTDHAKGWGTLMLADSVGQEAPAPQPEWLARLVGQTGKPDRLERRLRRLDAGEMDVAGRIGGWVVVELIYPGLDSREETGQARLFLPPVLRDDPARRVPLIHAAGYELDENGASGWLAQGYAVSTPHDHPLNPLGRGVNLDRAILHAVRRLPFIDPRRVSIKGGSAGGWMTLMLAADAFPLVWAMPDVPPVHWGYNAAYIEASQVMAAAPAGADLPRLPVLLAVGVVSEQSKALYGMPFESETYLAVSPLAHLETVTAPTLVTFSTADMLVPIDQVGKALVQPFDAKSFPVGFSTAMSGRFPGVGEARTLLEALPPERYALFTAPPDDRPMRLGPYGAPQGEARPLTLPFAKDKTWSIVIIDEGPVEPEVGHFKYHWTLDGEPFRRWAESQGVTADQLTRPKLERLMRRWQGEPWRPFRARPGGKGEEIAACALDYPEAERADVLLGLTAFAADDACALRLARLYAELPSALKALGDRLGDGSAAGVRAALDAMRSDGETF